MRVFTQGFIPRAKNGRFLRGYPPSKGIPRTQEVKDKIRNKLNKHNYIICSVCGKKKFVCLARTTDKFCSRKCHGKSISGEKHPNWKGGISKDKKYSSWIQNKRNRLRYQIIAHTFDDWKELKKRFDFTCLCCGKKEPEINLSEDHIIPISKGGDDKISNIQPLCHSCNSKKHNKIINYILVGVN